MAEEDERELTEEEQAEQARKKKRKQRLLLSLLGIGLVLLSVGSTLALLHFFGGSEPQGDAQVESEAQTKEPPEPVEQQAIYYPLTEKLIIDYNIRGRQRFLQVEVSLMFRDNEISQAIEQHLPRIRNDLNLLLKGQAFEDLQTPEGKELVRQDARRRVNAILEEEVGKTGVEQVLFTSFVMQ